MQKSPLSVERGTAWDRAASRMALQSTGGDNNVEWLGSDGFLAWCLRIPPLLPSVQM